MIAECIGRVGLCQLWVAFLPALLVLQLLSFPLVYFSMRNELPLSVGYSPFPWSSCLSLVASINTNWPNANYQPSPTRSLFCPFAIQRNAVLQFDATPLSELPIFLILSLVCLFFCYHFISLLCRPCFFLFPFFFGLSLSLVRPPAFNPSRQLLSSFLRSHHTCTICTRLVCAGTRVVFFLLFLSRAGGGGGGIKVCWFYTSVSTGTKSHDSVLLILPKNHVTDIHHGQDFGSLDYILFALLLFSFTVHSIDCPVLPQRILKIDHFCGIFTKLGTSMYEKVFFSLGKNTKSLP